LEVDRRLFSVPLAFLLAIFLSAAGTTLTTLYFPPSDSGSPLDMVMRGQFAAILAETNEPVLHQPRGHNFAVRVTAYTVRGAVTFLRIERKSDGAITSTFKRYGFTELGAPILRSVVESDLTSAAFTRLSDEIQRQRFFSIASSGTVATVDMPVCLIEVYDGRAYHSAYRSGCPRDMAFGLVAMRAAEIAGVDYFAD
jgi:hypothetical protein